MFTILATLIQVTTAPSQYHYQGWIIGVGLFATLVVVIAHERRQAKRITERTKELEHLSAELLRVNQAKSEFLANVSHELRTPLNAIVGFADLLRNDVYGVLTPRQAGPVERIEASANHLRHLVDQILDLAKIAAGRLELHLETINLRPFILDVVTEVEPLVVAKQLRLTLLLSTSFPKIQTDPTRVRQILVNLIGNAVKHTSQGTITIKTHTTNMWIAVQVSDTGSGIPQTDQNRIFEEFEQVNAGSRSDSMNRGTGLGLPISRKLARLLNGDITVESTLGQGSTFTMWLPLCPNSREPVPTEISPR